MYFARAFALMTGLLLTNPALALDDAETLAQTSHCQAVAMTHHTLYRGVGQILGNSLPLASNEDTSKAFTELSEAFQGYAGAQEERATVFLRLGLKLSGSNYETYITVTRGVAQTMMRNILNSALADQGEDAGALKGVIEASDTCDAFLDRVRDEIQPLPRFLPPTPEENEAAK